MKTYIVYRSGEKPVTVTADRYEIHTGAYERKEACFYRKLERPTPWQVEEEVNVLEGNRLVVEEAD